GLASLRAVVGINGLTSLISLIERIGVQPPLSPLSFPPPPPPALQCPSDRPLALSSGLLASLLQPGVVGSQNGDVRLAVLRLLQDLAPEMTVDTTSAATAGAAEGGSRCKEDQVPESEAVIGARIEAVSALQKRQGSGGNSGGSGGDSGGVAEPDSGDLQEELDALLATRRALIGRKVAVARGESGGGGSGGGAGGPGGRGGGGKKGGGGMEGQQEQQEEKQGAAGGAAVTGAGSQQPLMFLGAP
ncbi:unnamed protein product, partial [Closterium sp. NIES-65]